MGRREDEQVLEALLRLDISGDKRVDAGAFQEVLEQSGIPLGTPSADDIVLQCKVENDGLINFAPLEEALNKTKPVEHSRPHPPAPRQICPMPPPNHVSRIPMPAPPPKPSQSSTVPALVPPAPAMASAPAPPAPAMASTPALPAPATASAPAPSPTPVPAPSTTSAQRMAVLSPAAPMVSSVDPNDPKERVRQYTDALHDAFRKYDNGNSSLEELRSTVRKLGLQETPAYMSLLRHGTFDMTFAQFLQALLRVEPVPEYMQQGPVVPGRRFAHAPRSTDVVTWRQPSDKNDSGRPVSPRAQESINSPWHTKLDDANPFSPHVYVSSPGHHHASRRRFEPDTLEALSSHITFQEVEPPKSTLPPETEALKKRIYDSIRLLDQGVLTTSAFEKHIKDLGVKMPEEVRVLLDHAKLDGTVVFRDFALAFEPVFRPWLGPAGAVPPSIPAPVIAPPPTQVLRMGELQFPAGQVPPMVPGQATPVVSRAQTSHGDLIAWSQAPTALEGAEIANARAGRRYERSFDAHRQDHVDLTWDTERTAPPFPTEARKAHVRDVHVKPTLDMLAWDTSRK